MTQATIKREYSIDVDDLVDQLLASVRQNGFTLSKMQYETSRLEATRKSEKQSADKLEKAKAVQWHLVAEWKDFEDAVELSVTVDSESAAVSVEDCREQCLKALSGLPEERTYQSLYQEDPGAIFEEFENNN